MVKKSVKLTVNGNTYNIPNYTLNINMNSEDYVKKTDYDALKETVDNMNATRDVYIMCDDWIKQKSGDYGGYYTVTINVNKIYDLYGDISLLPTNGLFPLDDEIEVFNEILFVVSDDVANTITFVTSKDISTDYGVDLSLHIKGAR